MVFSLHVQLENHFVWMWMRYFIFKKSSRIVFLNDAHILLILLFQIVSSIFNVFHRHFFSNYFRSCYFIYFCFHNVTFWIENSIRITFTFIYCLYCHCIVLVNLLVIIFYDSYFLVILESFHSILNIFIFNILIIVFNFQYIYSVFKTLSKLVFLTY